MLFFSDKLALGFLGVMTVGYYLGSYWLIGLFMENPEIVACGGRLLRGLCLAQPFLCVDFMAVGVFQACGMGRKALVFAILRKIVLEIPALIVLNRLWPLYGLAYAQPLAEVVLAAAAVGVLARMFRSPDFREGT